ncbi:neurotactin [Dendroctonus ponderosae]|uniref:Carboxylesterase type B domain-containing protein n=3 Tax=Dendroctonus ponderosae TaxID=77166 RepID=A0AAR5PHC9_DENPD|nr:neurotactin [Dendroctonus ponderosae]XP_048525221.1 neurotactin [Dendroctonus ponderosae]XP_048525225.1 neurotactin [Dendroctonus ponderosae]
MSQIESVQESLTPVINEDKKSIQEEEREKILNVENEQKNTKEMMEEKKLKEGMEVKPKKIPIGGIQMPGFFTRSKSKEQCKEDDQIEGTELIEQDNEKKEESAPVQTRIKLPNPFKKNKETEEDEKTAEPKDRLKLLDTIRVPLVSVFERMKKNTESQNLTKHQVQAELASMETLDEKSNDEKDHGELKNVPLDDKSPKDIEKQQEPQRTWSQKLKDYRLVIAGLLLFLFVIIFIIIFATSGKKQYLKTPPLRDGKFIETTTSCGKVEGKMEDSAYAFRGIPYARPPVNDLRFKYAKPLNQIGYCWNGTLLAHNATPTCMQMLSNGTVIGIEDCLTLDIVTPAVKYDNPLPVIVLIGADSFNGGSPGKMRPSARYARSRDVVFVRPNFRLGVLGFLSHDILSKADYPHTSGNYGLSDILLALNWIQLNIQHFGGDKDSVTLFGHKAGATIVTALTTIHNANKYFTRAWASSGGAIYPSETREKAELHNMPLHLKCETIECLRTEDPEKLMKAVPHTWIKPQPDLPGRDETSTKRHQWLVIDGIILRESPRDVWLRSKKRSAEVDAAVKVDLVIGSTAQAGSSELLLLKNLNWTEGFVRHHVKESYIGVQNMTEQVLSKYPKTYQGLSAMITDIRIVCPLYAVWREMHNVHFYVVNQTRGDPRIADIDSDIDAILGRYEPKTPEQRRYFSAMQGMFYHYVWHGKVDNKFWTKNVLIVDQDVLPQRTYNYCDFWILKNFVLTFAAMD